MTAYAESSEATVPEVRTVSASALTWHGVRAGLVGAATIALWFLYVDFVNGHPLYTPTLLGTSLFGGGGIVSPAISFTLVHCVVFALIGVAGARLVAMIEGGSWRRLGLAALLLFIILDLGFSSFALTARAVGLEALSWPGVLLGNGLAAAAMITYLWRRRPHPS
jgi:hypothetical protein